MKSFAFDLLPAHIIVAPLAGAWIEMDEKKARMMRVSVAPLAGAWIEIMTMTIYFRGKNRSLPSRERGLKSTQHASIPGHEQSLPSRERGLKYAK